jgi:hypothetical protein
MFPVLKIEHAELKKKKKIIQSIVYSTHSELNTQHVSGAPPASGNPTKIPQPYIATKP